MRHFLRVLSFDLLAKVALGAASIALIRYMPVSEYALYTFALAAAGLAAQIISAGINRVYIIGFDRYELAEKVEILLVIQVAAVAAVALAAAAFGSVFRGLYLATVVLAGTMVISEFAKTYYQRTLHFPRYSTVEVVRAGSQGFAIGVLLLIYQESINAATVVWAQSAALALAFCVVLCPVLRWRRFADFSSARALAHSLARGPYVLLFVYFSVIAVFSQVDVVAVRWLTNDHVLATYGAALRYYGLLSLALGAVHVVLLPAVQQARSRVELDQVYAQHFRLVLIFMPVVFLAAIGAEWVMPWVDEGRYPDAVAAFRVMAASAVVSFAFSPHANLLLKQERFTYLVTLIVVALAINVGMLLWLVPEYGAVGAAVAMLTSAACVTIPIYFESRRLRLRQT